VAPRLAAAVADDRAEVRDAAAETLAVLGTVALGPLTETLVHADEPKARATAAMALGRLGRDGAPAEAVLKKAAVEEKDTDARVQGVGGLLPGGAGFSPRWFRC
jgi:HEAT repeat protein